MDGVHPLCMRKVIHRLSTDHNKIGRVCKYMIYIGNMEFCVFALTRPRARRRRNISEGVHGSTPSTPPVLRTAR